jgi:hypothetical protein
MLRAANQSRGRTDAQKIDQNMKTKKLEIYDPAMCCQTGVCGTEVDPKLVQFAGDLAWLKQQGVSVERFNLAHQPAAFATNPVVTETLKTRGNGVLPLVLVDGAIATSSIYPTRGQLAALAGVTEESSGCCGENDGETCCEGDEGKGSCCCG